MRKIAVRRLSLLSLELAKKGFDVSSPKKIKRAYLRKDQPQGKPFDIKAYKARMSKKKSRAKKRKEKNIIKKAA